MPKYPEKCVKCGTKIVPTISPRGRKPLLTTERAEQLAKEIRAGIPTKTAAVRAGIAESTFYLWLDKGRGQKKGKFSEFLGLIHRAEADRRATHALELVKAARGTEKKPGDWRARAWVAERVDSEEFGLRVNVQVTEVLTLGAERLAREFAHEPEIFERAIRSLTGRGVFSVPGAARAEEEAPRDGSAPPAVAAQAAPDPD